MHYNYTNVPKSRYSYSIWTHHIFFNALQETQNTLFLGLEWSIFCLKMWELPLQHYAVNKQVLMNENKVFSLVCVRHVVCNHSYCFNAWSKKIMKVRGKSTVYAVRWKLTINWMYHMTFFCIFIMFMLCFHFM